jgi:hypothetical protein
VIEELVCAWRGHRWLAFGEHETLRYAERDYCSRCEANRLRFGDGDVLVVRRADVVVLSPAWLEGLYRARWGEYPRQRVVRGGAFPEEWQWSV